MECGGDAAAFIRGGNASAVAGRRTRDVQPEACAFLKTEGASAMPEPLI